MGLTMLVLAGDSRASHPVFGANKALLPIHGRALVAHVVRTLADVPQIDRVFVVGPPARLRVALAGVGRAPDQERRILPQGPTMYDNVMRTFLATLTDDATPDAAALADRHADAVIGAVAGDAPLLTAAETQDFLTRADMTRYDYVLGLTPIDALEPFTPSRQHSGVRMAALNVAEGGFRQNNLHVLRPFRIVNRHYLEEFYEARYQKQWWNALRLIASVAWKHEGTAEAVGYVIRMQMAMRAQYRGWEGVLRRARRGVTMADVSTAVGRLLRTRFTALVCPGPGAALDVDNEHDLASISAHFTEWRRRLLAADHAA